MPANAPAESRTKRFAYNSSQESDERRENSGKARGIAFPCIYGRNRYEKNDPLHNVVEPR